ncbi:PSD1 and planctomycete cytochrome C domain-containing protein [Rubellicoccus peritrichatus]|uniref:PSD1 and planctomycete cytochrome C domain-containing protein n=1 Tax=Rubellicoccus peritrichatus TaxID=3080537 RepID=A0AAQ3L7P3_9BACT|nr:PSD1 and planctomycete cytochrome C domain-containing protein [Puniceicoccus sp. CR14]WOO39384.1 PSD1 and planctomycete cytochrome C domain-containing protein [Puniceicoccus sp. CR14]
MPLLVRLYNIPIIAFVLPLFLLLGCADSTKEASVADMQSDAASAHEESGIAIKVEPISFNRDVRPILSENCYFCHGPDETNNKADLRLDLRDAAIASGVLVPGDAANSELVKRIMTDDVDDVMPPPDAHKTLTDEQKALMARWIDEGAEYEGHWSYQRVERPDYASIDAIVSNNLKERGLNFSPPADKETLVRRVYLDVTGLPPTPEEARAFLDDESTDAYEKLIDRLLESPHYGEYMAIYWLDAVRFADSVGYHGDQSRDASAFRDYVIEAFNANMPFDQFTIEQIAGDLLPDPTLRQRIAASYNHLNQVSKEGGIQDKEYIKKYQAERVRTTSTAWLGSTLACAECHDHKFDPFTAKDFYSFSAFFADILEKGAWTGNGSYQEDIQPFIESLGLHLPKQTSKAGFGLTLEVPNRTFLLNQEKHELELEAHKQRLNAGTPSAHAEFETWLAAEKRFHEQGIQRTYQFEVKDTENDIAPLELNLPSQPIKSMNFQVAYNDKVENKKAQFGVVVHFDTKSYLLAWGDDIEVEGLERIKQKRPWRYKAVNDQSFNLSDLKLPSDVEMLNSIEFISNANEEGDPAFKLQRVDVTTRRYDVPKGTLEDENIALVEEYLAGTISEENNTNLRHKFFEKHASSEDLSEAQEKYSEVNNLLNGSRYVPATVSAKPREIKILPRGNWMDESGEVVLPTTPSFLPDLRASTETERLTRLDLAQWIVSRENPLTARAYVNRLWAQYFGTALSSAPEDLGLQGEYPVYPELLEWLAAEFMESGWDVKRLVKQIVMSRTYRQSSEANPELMELDPYNRLLARQTPRRLPAESIRDNALAASGLLVRNIGGPSVRPYQPANYYQHLNFPRRKYVSDTNHDQYRRGVYTHWQRTFLHPMLMAFDAPSRDECTVLRAQSNTPLQALNLLNDPTFVEAAKALADKLVTSQTEDELRLADAFEAVLMREPSKREMEVMLTFLSRERERFAEEPERSKSFLNVGLYRVNESIPKSEIAAWTSVCRAIFNLNESITKY